MNESHVDQASPLEQAIPPIVTKLVTNLISSAIVTNLISNCHQVSPICQQYDLITYCPQSDLPIVTKWQFKPLLNERILMAPGTRLLCSNLIGFLFGQACSPLVAQLLLSCLTKLDGQQHLSCLAYHHPPRQGGWEAPVGVDWPTSISCLGSTQLNWEDPPSAILSEDGQWAHLYFVNVFKILAMLFFRWVFGEKMRILQKKLKLVLQFLFLLELAEKAVPTLICLS